LVWHYINAFFGIIKFRLKETSECKQINFFFIQIRLLTVNAFINIRIITGIAHINTPRWRTCVIMAYAAGRSNARLSTHTTPGLVHGPGTPFYPLRQLWVYKNSRMQLTSGCCIFITKHGVYLSARHKAGAAAKNRIANVLIEVLQIGIINSGNYTRTVNFELQRVGGIRLNYSILVC
jgi:hypothetical protein